jgi:hypothetical protein
MDTINNFMNGFNVITTPYDKVDNTKRNINGIINMIGGVETGTTTVKDGNSPSAGTDPSAGTAPAPASGPAGTAPGVSDPELIEKANETTNTVTPTNEEDNSEDKKEGGLDKFRAFALKRAKASEEEEVTELPEGKYLTENMVKIGSMIIYIMLLPLLPWYYIMKHSYSKIKHLFDGMLKPL